jgi:alkylhydroperoxidase family enzyme
LEIEALDVPASWTDVFEPQAEAVLRLSDEMSSDSHPRLDAGLVPELRRLFTEGELAELILVAGQANLNNRAGNAAKQLLGD